MRCFFIFIWVFLYQLNCFSQTITDLEIIKEKYPNSNFVRLHQENVISIELDEGEFTILQEVIEENVYLDESATYNSKQSISFSSFFEMQKIEASSYLLDDGKYIETKIDDFKEKDDLENSFYDDTKSLNFIYPNLNKWSKTKLKYTQKINNPRFLNAFYFGNFYPIINNKLTIIADKKIQLRFQQFNTEKNPVVFTKTENRKNNIYTWELKNVDEFEFEENSISYKSILPHIIPIISSYTTNESKMNMLSDVADLYRWYYSLIQNINKDENDKDLVELVQKLIKDKPNNLEKARAIYYWTQENIKYIAFEYALGGFVPRESNDVFKKKYGDCKDNSSILFKMLEIAGIKGNLTWIGTRSIPYTYSEVPTPLVDNHMILSFEDENKTYYLDATGRYTSIDAPTSFIQGKEALVAKGENLFEIKLVPTIAPKLNAFIDTTNIIISNSEIIGKSKSEISGYLKSDYFYSLEKQNTDTKLKDFYNTALEKGNNSFLIKNIKELNKFEYDKNLVVAYDFSLSNYAKFLGDEIYINLNLNKRLLAFKNKENRKTAIEYEYTNYYEYQTSLSIPEGYIVNYLPENTTITNEYITSNINYKLTKETIEYTHTVELNTLILDLDAQKKVNDLIKQMELSYKEVVILQKKP
ncbi:MAG: DUF3857 and transglutaminase domain-containing protein [Cellulophaga sp.]|nr:DUF3857 and transglutaminase domain-containing protein [Cellulophaga sp.]